MRRLVDFLSKFRNRFQQPRHLAHADLKPPNPILTTTNLPQTTTTTTTSVTSIPSDVSTSGYSSSYAESSVCNAAPKEVPITSFGLPTQFGGRRSRKSDRSDDKLITKIVEFEEKELIGEQNALFEAMQNDVTKQEEWNKRFPEGAHVVYTDGSCWNKSASGFGIYHGPAHPLNRAERIEGPLHNSGLAEIVAATRAVEQLKDWGGLGERVVIVRTDYLALIHVMNKGTAVNSRFSAQYALLREKCKELPYGVQFEHVYAHAGDDPGNDAADILARYAMESHESLHRRARSLSPTRFNIRSRDRSRERGRSASRDNCRTHIRSHSAYVRGRKRLTPTHSITRNLHLSLGSYRKKIFNPNSETSRSTNSLKSSKSLTKLNKKKKKAKKRHSKTSRNSKSLQGPKTPKSTSKR